jgi:hypothetical protein
LPSKQFLLLFVAIKLSSNLNMPTAKKRIIKSLENLTEDLKEVIREQYPNGYDSSITRITNAKKEPIFVFPIETEDATILVKVPVTKNSDGEYDVDSTPTPGEPEDNAASTDDEGFAAPGSSDEDEDSGFGAGSGDYDDEGGGRKSREASYDPDFDN